MAMHHPFTAPMDEDLDKLESDKKNCRAKAYDIVLNGTELGGGSIRISVPETQQAMFRALGFSDEDAQERFGHLINAFKFGAPPHGGLAYGLDRLCMLMAGAESIRDVIAFPKVQNASEPMTNCPDFVDDKQLDDLSLAVTRREDRLHRGVIYFSRKMIDKKASCETAFRFGDCRVWQKILPAPAFPWLSHKAGRFGGKPGRQIPF